VKKRRQKTFKTALTIKEKPGERQKTAQNSVFPIETTIRPERNKQRNPKNGNNHKINDDF